MNKTIEKEINKISKRLLDKCLEEASLVAEKAGKYSLKFFGSPKTIKKKGKNDIVTEVDIKCEEIIKHHLFKTFKDFAFFGEESQEENTDNPFSWIVDPIDGTSNFTHGYPFYCVSIGLAYKNVPILGVIYAPLTNSIYKAHIKSRAYKNNKVINVSKTKNLIDSMIITGFYYNITTDDNFLKCRMTEFQNVAREVRAIRRDGSAALDLCFVAEGIVEGFFECGLSAWDVCAGIVIIKQAGGLVTDLNLGSYDIFSKKQFVATNKHIHKKLTKLL